MSEVYSTVLEWKGMGLDTGSGGILCEIGGRIGWVTAVKVEIIAVLTITKNPGSLLDIDVMIIITRYLKLVYDSLDLLQNYMLYQIRIYTALVSISVSSPGLIQGAFHILYSPTHPFTPSSFAINLTTIFHFMSFSTGTVPLSHVSDSSILYKPFATRLSTTRLLSVNEAETLQPRSADVLLL